jgi:CDGSH-type Zn-finger protein
MNEQIQEQTTERAAICACGRSPLGHCIGWHKLSEDEFRQALAEWESTVIPKNNLL